MLLYCNLHLASTYFKTLFDVGQTILESRRTITVSSSIVDALTSTNYSYPAPSQNLYSPSSIGF